MISVFALQPADLQERITSAGFPLFRFKQLVKWLYQKAVNDLDAMTDLPVPFKTYLTDNYDLSLPHIVQTLSASDGSVKFLLQLKDGGHTECVLMPDEDKNTLCVSSQIGCAFNCAFCATGTLGPIRDLSVEEIVGQVMLAVKHLGDKRLTNIVFMGMGEPLDNLDNVIPAINIIQNDYALQFSSRRMTISTCGYVPRIYELADMGIKIKLAVSLNSAINDKRDQLMPVNRTYNLHDLKQAMLYFRSKSPWRITIEYIMIPGFNMSEADARALIGFIGDLSCKLNLIAWNPVPGLPWKAPSQREALAFQERLRALPIAVTIRKSRGAEIAAACGQLAACNINKEQ